MVGLKWLAAHFVDLPAHRDIADARMRAQWFGRDIFVDLEEADALAFVEGVSRDPEVLQFCAFLADGAAHRRQDSSADVRSAGELGSERRLAQLIQQAFEAQGTANPLDYPDDVWYLIRPWERMDPDSVRGWVEGHLREGHWPMLDLLARMVGTATPLGVPNPIARLEGLDLEFVDRMVGIERARADLSDQLAEFDGAIGYGTAATPANRRHYALKVLSSQGHAQSLDQ